MLIVGLYHGQVLFYSFDSTTLKFLTQMDCKNRRGEYRYGKKITGISFFRTEDKSTKESSKVSENSNIMSLSNTFKSKDVILLSSNDDRLRLCDVDDFSMFYKLKGLKNKKMQIKASFSEDGKYIISGSEDGYVYIWNRVPHLNAVVNSKTRTSHQPDRNQSYESFQAARGANAAATVALFAPLSAVTKATEINSGVYILDYIPDLSSRIIVTGDHSGGISVFSRGLDV